MSIYFLFYIILNFNSNIDKKISNIYNSYISYKKEKFMKKDMPKECFFTVKSKNKNITHNLKFLESGQTDGFYDIRCYDNSEKEMGLITFKFLPKKVWLYKVETHPEFAHQGVATALIQTMEYVCMKNNVNYMEAKYYPENEFAKPFYEKHKYNLPNQNVNGWDGYDETWTMFKYLDFDFIKEKIAPNISFEKGKEIEM